jgi:hypothetical protein
MKTNKFTIGFYPRGFYLGNESTLLESFYSVLIPGLYLTLTKKDNEKGYVLVSGFQINDDMIRSN